MPEPNKCPQCGTPLPTGALAGLCPACLLKMGAAADTVTDAKQPPFHPPSIAELAPLFPQLEILELIGKGGMGAVYKARQKQLDRIVALKILPPGIGHDAAFAERFAREAKALAKLNHPNIVTLYEFGDAGGQFYFLMEFVDGVNLRQLLQAGRISAREALAIVPQICDALQFAHDQGIVHRDIKPENILLDRRGRVKVADFGLAKIIESRDATINFPAAGKISENLTDAGKTMGTPNYMSPEQITAPGEVDHRADIYALGVVFYQMLTGELPGKKIEAPSTKVQIDVRLDEIVLRALEKNPELRFQQVSEVKTCVETIAENLKRDATPENEPQFSRGWLDKKDMEHIVAGFFGFTGLLGWWLAKVYGEPLFYLFFLFFLIFGFWIPVIIRVLQRKPESRFQQALESQKPEVAPRFSRTAIVGACWMPLFFITFVLMFWASKVEGEYRGPARWLKLLQIALFLAGVTAPFGTTILGWVAVSQIRRSAGKIYGMGLAVFDGLLFPLLVLDFLIWYLCIISTLMFRNGSDASGRIQSAAAALIISVIISALVDWLIIRRVWRAVNKTDSVAPAKEAEKVSDAGKNSPRAGDAFLVPLMRNIFWKWLVVMVLAAILIPIAIKMIVHSVDNPARRATALSSAEFHYRVFEADAALVDKLIPAAQRQPGVQPTAKFLARYSPGETQKTVGSGTNSFIVTKHGNEDTDSQVAVIDLDTLHELLEGIAKNPGVLVNQSQTVTGIWWPTGTATGWAYSTQKDGLALNGSGGINLAYTVDDVRDKIRIEGRVSHNPNFVADASDITAKFLYEGDAPLAHALAFLVPFFWKDNSAHYFVVVYEIRPVGNLSEPPFIARINQGEVELLAVGDQPWTNTVCWLANGAPSDKPFPIGSGSMGQWSEGKVTKKIAFRIHNESSEGFSFPIGRDTNDAEVGIGSSGLSWPVRYGDATFIQLITCPTNAQTMNFSLGIANGKWETAITLKHAADMNNGLGGAESFGSPTEGDWSATWNAIIGRGDVAINCNYSKNTNWASRMVGVDDDGKITVIPENSSSVSALLTGGILLVSSNEFARIKEFQLQRRKYQWVEFKNVSLQPGHATQVKMAETIVVPIASIQPPEISASDAAPIFDTVIEEVVTNAFRFATGGQSRVAWADGKRLDVSPGEDKEKFLREHDIDLFADDDLGLYGIDIKVMRAEWNPQISYERLAGQLQSSNRYTLYGLNGVCFTSPGTMPAYWFETRDGLKGILQITGFTENPRGVKLRYKLVQNGNATGSNPAVSPALLTEPPKLRYLEWDEDWKTNYLGGVHYPDGSLVTNKQELAWLEHVSPGMMSDVSGQPNLAKQHPHFLHLWFSHPLFDDSFFAEVTLADENGKNPADPYSSRVAEIKAADPQNGNIDWLVESLMCGAGTNIPAKVTVRLRYTVGPLEQVQEIPSDYTGYFAILGGSQLDSIGQDARGNTLVTIGVNPETMKTRQYCVEAATKDGRKLMSGGGISGNSDGSGPQVARFYFNVPLADVAKFIIGTRPIRTNEWKNVVLPSN